MRKSAQNKKNYAEPWQISFEERARYLQQCIEDKCQIVLHLNEEPNTTTFRYRCYNVFRWLQDSKKWRAVYFFLDEFPKLKHYLPNISMAIVSRMRWSFELQRFIDILRDAKKPILYDTDDLVFDVELLPMLVSTISADMDYYFSYTSRCGYAASLADGFTTTNSFLGNRLTDKYGKPYAIIPNTLNQEQLDISHNILNEKGIAGTPLTAPATSTQPQTVHSCENGNPPVTTSPTPNNANKPFTIGYFSGTNTHNNDFNEVLPELISLMEKYPNIYLDIVGFLTLPREAMPLFKAKRIKQRKLVNMLELQQLISQVDVNIAPLTINVFTQCKSELKYFEAAIVETITCATPTGVFKDCITHGENGFLCNQGEWFNTIESIYHGEVNRDQIAKTAHNHAIERYSGKQVKEQIETAYDEILAQIPQS